jgi:hypothetical protein
MNVIQQALILANGDLLESIANEIKGEWFEEWQASKLVEDRELLHAQTSALELVIYKIEEKAKKLNGTTE